MRVALLQLNLVVGDVRGNAARIRLAYEAAAARDCDLAVSTELSLLGYPPQDLLLREDVLRRQREALGWLAAGTGDVPLAVGIAEAREGVGKPLFNAVAVLRRGAVAGVRRKSLLPTYDVFDERRYFEPFPGAAGPRSTLDGRRIDVPDLRGHLGRHRGHPALSAGSRYPGGPCRGAGRAACPNN